MQTDFLMNIRDVILFADRMRHSKAGPVSGASPSSMTLRREWRNRGPDAAPLEESKGTDDG